MLRVLNLGSDLSWLFDVFPSFVLMRSSQLSERYPARNYIIRVHVMVVFPFTESFMDKIEIFCLPLPTSYHFFLLLLLFFFFILLVVLSSLGSHGLATHVINVA